jgi:RNA polymerase sigma-70 factor (ECF subfamily)
MQRSVLKDALSTLRVEQREIVVLAYYGGLTHSEIARKLGQSPGTVKTRMRLALKKLRQVLDP